MLSNYKEVLKIDDQLANKKFYDPRSYALLAQKSMAERVREVCKRLNCIGSHIKL
jgi:fructose/tagatose bisphosphate aldolase